MSSFRGVSLLSGAICLLGVWGCDAGPGGASDEQQVSSVTQAVVAEEDWKPYHGGGAGTEFSSHAEYGYDMKLFATYSICGTYVDQVQLRGQQNRAFGPYGGYWDGSRTSSGCPAGYRIAGVKGRTGSWVDQLTFVCRNDAGRDGGLSTVDLPTCGTSGGGEYFEDICDIGKDMVAVKGRQSEYGVEGIQIGCGYTDIPY